MDRVVGFCDCEVFVVLRDGRCFVCPQQRLVPDVECVFWRDEEVTIVVRCVGDQFGVVFRTVDRVYFTTLQRINGVYDVVRPLSRVALV